MYHGSNHFGKARQEELLKTANIENERTTDRRIQHHPREQGILSKLIGGLFRKRKEVESVLQTTIPDKSRSANG
jgi:hypothetical protein